MSAKNTCKKLNEYDTELSSQQTQSNPMIFVTGQVYNTNVRSRNKLGDLQQSYLVEDDFMDNASGFNTRRKATLDLANYSSIERPSIKH